MSNLPEKFIIPKERIPKAWTQGPYDCCVAASITKVLEVINYVKTGQYILLSKKYTYGRHNNPRKKQGGMDYGYVIPKLLERGTVPENMCPGMNEMPDVVTELEALPNIAELDKEAEKTKIEAFEKFPGNIYFYENVKRCLYEHQMPLVGNMVGKRHCTVIVGWDGDKLLYHDHNGKDDLSKGKFNEAYYLDGGIEKAQPVPEEPAEETKPTINEVQEENAMGFKLIDVNDFKSYLDSLSITRRITTVQLHHTYSPAYKDFNGANHIKLQEGMRNYHTKTRNYDDIAQQFTIFPDGKICTGRDINVAPAGIYGANSTGICIECVGNFDRGGDTMTDAQKNAIVGAVKILLDKFSLSAKTGVTYHAWWTSGGTPLGTYIAGRSYKTCPGTNFFGGNTREAYEKNLLPLIENWKKGENDMALKPITEINDIVWELTNAGIITNGQLWLKKCEEDINVYWLCRKMANKLRGTL